MGADWYYPEVWYGYQFIPPVTQSFRSFLCNVYALREFIEAPFEIKCLLDSFHSRMEFDERGNRELDKLACVIVGFKPSNDLDKTMTWARELAEYIQNPMFMDLEFRPEAGFVTGIKWLSEVEDAEEESDLSSSSLSSASSASAASASSVSSSEQSTSDSLLSDHDDTVNYHGEEVEDDAEEAEEEVEEEAEEEAENHQKSDEEGL